MIGQVLASCPDHIDLTSAPHQELLTEKVEELIKTYGDIREIETLEEQFIREKDSAPIFLLLALKIAKSKLLVSRIKDPLTVSVVFAMYKEHNRIKTSDEHPHGEDFLRRKVRQLEWLFGGSPNINWQLIAVDDGCPEGSGEIAQRIVDKHRLNAKVRVLFLEHAIARRVPAIHPLTSTSESQKGGAVTYGMWYAAQEQVEGNHIIAFTDADLSTHLGQLGLLIDPILNDGKLMTMGTRRDRQSVVVKRSQRNNRGKLFIYLWKRLIPSLGEIIDTQCGFKAFKREIVVDILDDLIEKKFAFDIELLLKTSLRRNNAIARVPVAWIDSEAASTTTDLQPYLPMLQSIARMYKKYLPPNQKADEFAGFIRNLKETEFNTILNDIPPEITDREPREFISYEEVTVDDLRKVLHRHVNSQRG